jgi:hypothetical protein
MPALDASVTIPLLFLAGVVASVGVHQVCLWLGRSRGAAAGAIVRHGVLDPDTVFIQKPFSPAALGHKVRAAIDGAARLPS